MSTLTSSGTDRDVPVMLDGRITYAAPAPVSSTYKIEVIERPKP